MGSRSEKRRRNKEDKRSGEVLGIREVRRARQKYRLRGERHARS